MRRRENRVIVEKSNVTQFAFLIIDIYPCAFLGTRILYLD
ncbi:hypothetical protein SPACI_033410 [Sporomusa acidovorans DSM 3132]|uniref:Uncharacterized protein n=1 Tax=Sporomusa acidovorans (strain ATCC 49682 / DSM 3132 / Mol) TaxID=1123286 RepID=A0ABZ3J5C0_SPOA4|nr:hypothetical protein SPACI_42770 [Sporomusa acidovorans DSM 3132]SDF00490.1 hypothetical protein SAMN04488499_102940 [Sporomusa acidovorans]